MAIHIELTNEEAILLSVLLRRYSATDVLEPHDESEQQALWNLECRLEKTVDMAFQDGEELADGIERAREALRPERP